MLESKTTRRCNEHLSIHLLTMRPCPLGLEVIALMVGRPYVHLDCGNRVRHGSEQPYRRLLMLKGLTGLRMQMGSRYVSRAPTRGLSIPAKNLLNGAFMSRFQVWGNSNGKVVEG